MASFLKKWFLCICKSNKRNGIKDIRKGGGSLPLEPVAPVTRGSEKSLSDKWVESSTKRAARDALCHLGDSAWRLNASSPFVMRIGQKFAPISNNAVGYDKLMGINDKVFRGIGKERQFENLQSFFKSDEGRRTYCGYVKNNFKGFMNPAVCHEFTPGGFARNTLVRDNIKSFVNPLAKGKICSSLVKSSFAGLTLWGVVSKTGKSYGEEKSVKKAFFTFCRESFKSLLIWEAGSIGLFIGKALMPVGWLATVAGILGVSLASALSYKAVNKIIP